MGGVREVDVRDNIFFFQLSLVIVRWEKKVETDIWGSWRGKFASSIFAKVGQGVGELA